MITVDEANELVKGILSEKRYYHSVCVMERCAEYAEMLGLNVEDAKLIGILHDLAKEMKKNGYYIDVYDVYEIIREELHSYDYDHIFFIFKSDDLNKDNPDAADKFKEAQEIIASSTSPV